MPPGYQTPSGYRSPEPVTPTGLPLADFGPRLLAYLIDGLILAAVMLIPFVVVIAILIPAVVHAANTTPPGEPVDVGPLVTLYLVSLAVLIPLSYLVQYLYLVVYQVRKGQTIGKRALKIRVVRLADGAPLDTGMANRRWLVQAGCGLIGILALLDGLWQLWDQPYRQCLHDKWPQTTVVKVPA